MHEAIASKDVGIWLGRNDDTQRTAIDGSKCPITLGKAVAENASSSIVGRNKEIELLTQEMQPEETKSSDEK